MEPLPRLKVLREIHCGQDATDRAVDVLQAHRPDLLEDMLLEENGRTYDYFNVAFHILDFLKEHGGTGAAIPQTTLGKMDFMCELSRRLRAANGLPEMVARGRPLAGGPNEALPPLAAKVLDEGTKRRGELTQELADRVLSAAYERRPDLWYAVAEEYRHLMCLEATEQFRDLIREVAAAESTGAENFWMANELFLEGILRIYLMCGIDDR